MRVKKLLKRMYGKNRILVIFSDEIELEEPINFPVLGLYITKARITKVVGRVK
ncbi:MAG: hypothetical protein ACRCXT_19500 [Paraclostridium sp.]